MSYTGIGLAAQDSDLQRRVAACVAQEQDTAEPYPPTRASEIMWSCCGEPGWGEAYASALASDNPAPGADPSVIPDAWILTAVQKWLPEAPETLPAGRGG